MKKEEVLSQVLSLNDDTKNYVVTVEGDKIITQVKWMDATFFSPTQITNEMRDFKYVVQLHNNGKYSEIDESVATTTSVSGSGFNKKFSAFKGKSISFNKTIGVGRDNTTGETGIISNTFYSEDYKKPVREFLKQYGYKRKMSSFAKGMIIATISVLLVCAVILAIVFSTVDVEKEALSVEKFTEIVENNNLTVTDASNDPRLDPEYVDMVLVAENDKMYIQYWDMDGTETAESMYDGNTQAYISEYSGTSVGSSGLNYERKEINGKNDEFVIISRIDDTIIIAETTKEYKDELKEIVAELSY